MFTVGILSWRRRHVEVVVTAGCTYPQSVRIPGRRGCRRAVSDYRVLRRSSHRPAGLVQWLVGRPAADRRGQVRVCARPASRKLSLIAVR